MKRFIFTAVCLFCVLCCGCSGETAGAAAPQGEVTRLPLTQLSLSKVGYSEGRQLVYTGEGSERLYGYLNEQGEVVIKPQYTMENTFTDGILRTKLSPNNYCYVDKNGKLLLDKVEGKSIVMADIFKDGYAVVLLEGCEGYYVIDTKGSVVLSPGEALYQYRNLGSGLFARTAAADGAVGQGATVTKQGATQIIKLDGSLPYGTALCDLQCPKGAVGFYSEDGTWYGVWDGAAGEKRTEPSYRPVLEFLGDTAVVATKDEAFWVIDKSGQCVLDVTKQFPDLVTDSLRWVDVGLLAANTKEGDTVSLIPVDGSAPVHTDYTSVEDFHEGIAVGEKDGLYGYLDLAGQEVLPATYPVASNLENGIGFLFDGTDIFRYEVKK